MQICPNELKWPLRRQIEIEKWDQNQVFYSYRVAVYLLDILLTIRLSPWSLASMLSTDVGSFGKLIWSMQNIISLAAYSIHPLMKSSAYEQREKPILNLDWKGSSNQWSVLLNPVRSFVSPVYDKIQTSRAGLAKLRKITLIHQYIDFYVVEEHNYMK